MNESKLRVPRSDAQEANDEFVRHASERVRQMLKAGMSRCEILTRLATVGEALAGPGASVSILFSMRTGYSAMALPPTCRWII